MCWDGVIESFRYSYYDDICLTCYLYTAHFYSSWYQRSKTCLGIAIKIILVRQAISISFCLNFRIFKNKSLLFFRTKILICNHPEIFPRIKLVATQNLRPIGSAVLTFTNKQTNRQAAEKSFK